MIPLYRFAVRSGIGLYYWLDGGELSYSSAKVYMDEMLDWQEWAYNLKRHERMAGVFQYYKPETVRFGFELDTLLRMLETRYEILAEAYLVVEELDTTTMRHVETGRFKLDFETMKREELWVSITIIHGGAAEALTAFEDTVYEIPLESSAPVANMDGMAMLGTYNYQTQGPDLAGDPQDIEISIPDLGINGAKSFGVAYIDQEGTLKPGLAQTAFGLTTPRVDSDSNFADAWCYKGLFEADVTIKVDDIPVKFRPPVDSENAFHSKLQFCFDLYTENWATSPLTGTLWQGDYRDPSGGAFFFYDEVISFDPWTFHISPGQYLVLYFRIAAEGAFEVGASGNVKLPVVPHDIFLSYVTTAAPTQCRIMSSLNVFAALCGRLGYGYRSDLLASSLMSYSLSGDNLFFTCSDALRNLYTDAGGNASDPKIKTSLKELVKNVSATYGESGIGVELDGDGFEIIVLERKEYFYNRAAISRSFTAYSDTYEIASLNMNRGGNLKFGYKTDSNDTANGRWAFNQEQRFRSNIPAKMPDIDHTCSYIADPITIETIRTNLAGKKTTDAESDNAVVMLCLNPVPVYGVYQLYRSVPVTGGLPTELRDSVYNVELTPMHQRLRNMLWLRTQYGGYAGAMLGVNDQLTFQTADRNAALSWIDPYTFSEYTEGDDFTVDGADFPMYSCKQIKIQVTLTAAAFATIKAYPYWCVLLRNFQRNGRSYDVKVHVDDLQRVPGTEEAAMLTGPLAADNILDDDF